MTKSPIPSAPLSRKSFLSLLGTLSAGLAVTPWHAAVAAGEARAAGTGGIAGSMRTRPIPSTGEALPVVGLGTWRTFDIGVDAEERAGRLLVLKILLEGGGSVIDSSPMYGAAEGVVGDLLERLRPARKPFIATKVWTRGRERGIAQMQQSAERLKTPVIDLMQIHNLLDWETHLGTLRAWKQEGRIRYLGITHYTQGALDGLADILERHPIDFVQMAYSIAVRDAEDRLLPVARRRGVAVLVNRPYRAGDLFSRVRGEKLPAWAAEFDCASWGQFFLKFILSHPAVTCVIPGTSKPRHMADNLGAGRGRLPDRKTRARMVRFMENL